MKTIDLNCDLGEGGGHDDELMALVTSVNIACGGHAGDDASMLMALKAAKAAGVSIGAHPSFEDREYFGRKEIATNATDVFALTVAQVQRLHELAASCGAIARHVKPHGALYNMAARDRGIAEAISAAVYSVNPGLVLYGLAGGELLRAGRARGLRVASEVFADRTYQSDGSLTPRSRADALIHDEVAAVAQVLRLVSEGRVRSVDGHEVEIAGETVCLHGDGPQAVAFARRLGAELRAAGVRLRSLTGP